MKTFATREEAYKVVPFDIENATFRFTNFSGKPSQFNREGDRSVTLLLDPEDAQDLLDKGWNVRVKMPREGYDGEPEHRLDVAISFRSFPNIPPAAIYTHVNGVTTKEDEDTVGELDFADIQSVDLTVRPRAWEDDRTGEWKIKAYLKEMHVVLNPNRWQEKYADYESPRE